MTYESSEISVASGRPIELYDIAMGLTHYRLTSSGEDVEYLGQTYESAPCKRSEIEQTGEIPKDGVDIYLPRGHALNAICIAGCPEQEITLTLYRGHSGFYVLYFRGFLTSVSIDKDGIGKYHFEPRSSDMPFVGGRRRCMRLCPYKLYSYRCGVNSESFKISGTIDTISGVTIMATEFNIAADFGSGGEILVGTARRMIVAHSGNEITINRPFGANVEAGDSFYAWYGCDHTPDTCEDVFDNIINYGGQAFLPVQNPYYSEIFPDSTP